MASCPSGMTVSSRTLTLLAEALRQRRKELGTRWRRLDPGQQALLVVAHLYKSKTYADLAIGFEIGVSTAYRYVREGLTLLAAMAPSLQQAMAVAPGKVYAVLDGSLLRIDRVAVASGNDRPYYCGKHKCHGVNMQVLADPAGRLVWVSPAIEGSLTTWQPRATTASSTPSACWRHRPGGHRLPGRRPGGPGAASAPAQGP